MDRTRYYLLLVAALSVTMLGGTLVGGGCGSSSNSAATEAPAASPSAGETTAAATATPTATSATPEPTGSAVKYTPGGSEFAAVWKAFYSAQDEGDIETPLIKAGSAMVPAICEAIAHVNMDRRRYAIGALGPIGDPQAIPALKTILYESNEMDYFRGDALQALYQLDRPAAEEFAEQNKDATGTLGEYVKAVLKNESWLTASPSAED
jgi:hypothetical protein